MPKLTLVLGRETMKVYDLDQPVIKIGRVREMDIVIDNVSVSRNHAEIRKQADGWIVRDTGSANGTFLNAERLTEDRRLGPGDEVSIGKFSIFFEQGRSEAAPVAARPAAAAPAGHSGTMFLKGDEVEKLQKAAAQKRQAQLAWEAKDQRAVHYLSGSGGALVGRDELCDLRAPAGPAHHVLVMKTSDASEVRNLCWLAGMRVNGTKTRRAMLHDGDVVEIKGLKLTFSDELR